MTDEQEPDGSKPSPWLPTWMAVTVVVIVTAAWVANVVIGYFDPARASMAVNAAFTIVMGLLVRSATVGRLRRRIGGDSSTPDRDGDGERP